MIRMAYGSMSVRISQHLKLILKIVTLESIGVHDLNRITYSGTQYQRCNIAQRISNFRRKTNQIILLLAAESTLQMGTRSTEYVNL